VKDYRSYSLWLDSVPDDLGPRAALEADADVDVAIVGGGYTGLWTAYYLAKADPALRIAVLEKEICGFGASGRNGGWCSALFAGSRERTERRYGRDGAVALQRAMFDTIDEIAKVLATESIDADFHKGGTLTLVTARVQLERVRSSVDYERSWGFPEQDYVWLDEPEARSRLNLPNLMGAAFSPHCARIHPGKLVRGLARVVEGLGVKIYEQTEVSSIEPRAAVTRSGRVRADIVIRATEGYSVRLPRLKRALMPLYSLMIATEPLPRSFWDEVGWTNKETLNDGRHLIIYAQRTADDRIAIGGRGAPYHFGSRIDDSFDRNPRVFSELRRALVGLMPGAVDARITHQWGGPLGVPRDWYTSVTFERATGLAAAGGYVGDGVATANLAGRTLTDLILQRDTEITHLPWVGHRSRKWEPEPLRWVGTNLALWTMATADKVERRTGRPARRAWAVHKLIGG
jgi:glycine/D-amino acid oxidase-like deaminating enzyme